jgi:hypothetical protein
MTTLLMNTSLKSFTSQFGKNIDSKICKLLKFRFSSILPGLVTILCVLISITSRCQTQQLNYTITKGGDNIGWLRLEKNIAGNTTALSLISEIKTRVIFLINVFAKDSSIFENRKMIYCSQLRKTNGSTKFHKQTRLVEEKYEVSENGKKENIAIPAISTNLLSLYFHEPIGINAVYCDVVKCFAPIVKTDDGGYKVKRPGGDSSTFYYSKGTCIKVIICQSLYTVNIILNQ